MNKLIFRKRVYKVKLCLERKKLLFELEINTVYSVIKSTYFTDKHFSVVSVPNSSLQFLQPMSDIFLIISWVGFLQGEQYNTDN